MKPLQILASKRGCPEHELRELERELSTCLPYDYRRFLQLADGGIAGPQNRFIHARIYPHLPCSIIVDRFFGIEGLLCVRLKYESRIPSAFLPIAENTFGDLVCLDLRPRGHPILYWDHESEDLGKAGTDIPALEHTAFVHVANTFTEFVEMLGQLPSG